MPDEKDKKTKEEEKGKLKDKKIKLSTEQETQDPSQQIVTNTGSTAGGSKDADAASG